MKHSRIIMRVEVSPGARKELDEVSNRFGLTQLAMISKCVQSFLEMPEMVQASILGIYSTVDPSEITTAILEKMAAGEE